MRRLALTLLTTVALAGVAGCSGSTTPSSAVSPSAPPPATSPVAASAVVGGSGSGGACATVAAGAVATVKVAIKDFSFNPQPAQAKVGDIVAWTNGDSAPHSATMDNGSCDTDTISGGSTALLVFTAPGTYTYHCKVHPGRMKGFTVEVK
ncbi:MAG: hypothetical protein NVS9B8_13370 [Candidatus Limnocylindrales bacterium]